MFTFHAFFIFGCYLLPCITAGKDIPACVFPFVFDGKPYNSCTKDGFVDGTLWCATTDNYDTDSKWKHCSLKEYGGNSNGKPCVFPFVYKNRTFYTCTDETKEDGKFWCSTTSNFDLQPQWSYCADTRLDANPKGPCVFPFLYNGTSYSSCTTDGISNKKLWCSLTNNYDVDLKWTYCEPSGRSTIDTGINKLTTEKRTTLHTGKVDQYQFTKGKSKVETGDFKSTTEGVVLLTTGKVDQSQATIGKSKVGTGDFKSTTGVATQTTGKIDQGQGTKGKSQIDAWIFKVPTEGESILHAGNVDQSQATKGGKKINLGICELTTGRPATLNTIKTHQDQVTQGKSKTETEVFSSTTERVATLTTRKVDPGQETKGPDEDMESPPCVFPFLYKGKSYQSCTADGWSDGRFWCATTNNYDADKKWTYCQVSGPDPDVESPPCTFPFIYKGKSYSTCTAEGMSDGTHWCATTSTYDVDKKWVYCNVTGPDTSKEGPTCVFPFIYNGMNYSSCTEDGRADGKLWCATTKNYDADKRWTFCTITKTGCVFPFIYKEKSYRSCIPIDHPEMKAWCSTSPNYDTTFKWRLCNELDCVFPFVFRGKTYYNCTTSGRLDRKLWCPLTSNPEMDRIWLFCADSGIANID